MAGVIRAQVELAHDSGLPKDKTVNVFHFQGAVPFNTGDVTAIYNQLNSFYQDIGSLLSTRLSGAGVVKFYYLDDTEPRQPVDELALSTITVGSGALPADVALCLSFQGVPVSGTPQARKRGRVYIGPLTSSILVSSTGRPVQSFIDILNGAAQELRDSAGTSWVVYSRVDDIGYTVNNGWIDNEFDTQRRRGEGPTTRTVF